MVAFIVTAVVGYLLGSISFSYLIAKKLMKIDIRSTGSGNAGATNTLRVLGVGPAIAVLGLDILKGIVTVWLAIWVSSDGNNLVPAVAGFAAIVGHNWPVYFNFRGGKGVATTIGVVATLLFYPALIAGIVAILSIVFTRFVSLGSLLFGLLTPVAALLLLPVYPYPTAYIWFSVLLALLSFWRHRDNLSRLLSGTESKIGARKQA
ncbi:glycerol-3-phosphate 1-O-acyltransferase PlsY [Shouchella shacheensis]|uniref:glycerol-3-phosphate 1-O-acyltransferase PlsY n=1 Tax=Shouchella shacheensis TaxID=1649580 RepID=UPI0007403771|nr:glycerol-3-phosphate 1-O-acyltransferase PlsY [Shouchella shacheensis]